MLHNIRYIGPQERLKGKLALVQLDGLEPHKCTAQFDDTSLPEAYGWHPFKVSEFDIRPSQKAEYWDMGAVRDGI